jgi:DNA-directed RNA polymerase alpha subunit
MDGSMPNSPSITQLAAYWKRNGLSTRASYVLAKAGISETQLVAYREISALLCLKNCGSETAKEISDFMANSEREVKEVKFEELIPN